MQLAARTSQNLCVPCTIEFQSSRSLPIILLLRVSLSRLGGKHRLLVRQVGDSASSSANSMAKSSDTNKVPEGTTLVFGSWACTADGSGGFSSHLVTPNSPKPKLPPNSLTSAGLWIPMKKEFYSSSTRIMQKTCQLQLELLGQSCSTQDLILKNFTFPKPTENT